ncbi:MAG TPA: nucleotide exchange factor GrpE [Gemmatimonadaceae bacterium]|jgi:molecular chaperone GrpE|nr:nucleotide exchange factor GrpE [Gemmatimonadaceae bacterium]
MTRPTNSSRTSDADPRGPDDEAASGSAGGPADSAPAGAGSGVPSGSGAGAETGTAARLEVELADQKDKYLRLAAEYDNFRKRTVRERQEAELRGMGVLVRGMLEALDDLGRFAHVDPATVDAATVVEGADMVEKKLLKTLSGHGLEVVNPMGEPFNPELHEALATMPAERPEQDHTVSQVYQVGYLFNGQLLRPARVVVTQWQAGS